ncbi:MAG: 4-hydroxy-3-methylbut-2-enyl diphosphate reductase [Flavobacteriales bacterium]|nr:4-hydroxy-3-methylbut-2-enyl diphosphate reductase [Flavobacteriales bacterium]
MKSFEIPSKYRSGYIGRIKSHFKISDPRKQNLSPAILNFGSFSLILPRHFGFCYGVENAIEIAYRAIDQNPGKRIFLISQMIHNPLVNQDLLDLGVRFLMDTDGSQIIGWSELKPDDIVVTPAFGTTVEIEAILRATGVNIEEYNTTCPFVEKVWKRSNEIGTNGYTVLIHGKAKHEETRATFSHATKGSPSIVVRNMAEAQWLGEMLIGQRSLEEFYSLFEGKYSEGFDPKRDLERLGVVNQTTMLATETQEIADYFKSVMCQLHGENYKAYFADTRDTLCYATNDNQDATKALLSCGADMALVIGGYNSSNTAQIHTILQSVFPSFFISGAESVLSKDSLRHYLYDQQKEVETEWMTKSAHPIIILTSGASCPDKVVDEVMMKIKSLFPNSVETDVVFDDFIKQKI